MTTSLRKARWLAAGLILGLPTTDLVAQAKPATVIPKNPLITLHIDGPAALRGAFLPTNLGKLFAGPEFKDMLAPVMQMVEGVKEQAGGQLPFDVADLEKAIQNYGGRLTAAFHLLDETVDINSGKPPEFAVTIALSPDGKTDLAGFCKKAVEFAKEGMGEALTELDVGGTTLSTFQDADSGEPGFCVPFMHKDHAVFLITKDFKKAANAVLGADAAHHEAGAQYASANVGASVNLKHLFKILTTVAKDNLGPQWDGMGLHIYKGSGLDSLETMDMTYRAKGPAVVSEIVFNFNQNDRGLIGSFFQTSGKMSSLVDLLPRNAMAASATAFDLKQLYKGIKSIFNEMGDAAPMSFDDIEEEFKNNMGLRLYEDLVGLFGTNLMSLQMESDEMDGGMDPMAAMSGLSFGLEVTNGAQLAKSIDTILRKNGLHAGRKKKEYKGYTVYSLDTFSVSYAVTDGLLLVGMGKAGGDAIRGTLDEVKNRAEGKAAEPLPKPVADRLKMVKGGYSGLGWTDIESQMESVGAQLDMISGQLPPEFDIVGDLLDKLPKLFKNYQLKHQVVVIRSDGNRWVYESIW